MTLDAESKTDEATPRLPGASAAFWVALWLAVALVACKAASPKDSFEVVAQTSAEKLRYLQVMTHQDLLYAAGLGVVGAAALFLARRHKRAASAGWATLILLGAASVLYGVASVPLFRYLGTPLTYPMLHVAGNVAHMGSSVANFLSAPLVAALLLTPPAYVVLVLLSRRYLTPARHTWVLPVVGAVLIAIVCADFAWGRREVREHWDARDDRGITRSAHWTFLASCAAELFGGGDRVRVGESFPMDYAEEFRTVFRRSSPPNPTTLPGPRPKNVIVVVLESVSSHYLSLYGSNYDTTPRLVREAKNSLVFDSVYSHVGMTANSLVSIVLGVYPPVTWRQLTDDRPDLPGTSLAAVMKSAGYRTAFITSGDNEYVNTAKFLVGRGFDVVWDVKGLQAPYLFTWGCEDRHMIDGVVRFIDQDPSRSSGGGKPFFALTWTQQTHHPYPLAEGATKIDFFKDGPTPEDDWDLGQYLNAIREADTQIGRLMDALKELGIADDTLIVITGDHGEAFGSPHPTYGHGPRVWEENLHVPLVLWNAKTFAQGPRRSPQIGGLCDLGATVCDVMGVAPAPDWQGRSLLDPSHPPRTYFSAANDGYLLALRDGNFKYILNATAGKEMLFDLAADPTEQTNLAGSRREQATEMRKRVSAWMASQKQRYGSAER
jgi:arylsulfatase A-like enzyme